MILFEDKDIIVCHKPAGLPVQSARLGQKDMVSVLNNHLAGQSQKMTDFVRVVHRLDQPVEGVIVFAKNQKAAANLTKQIQENRVQKVYQAVCCDVDKAAKSEKNGGECGKLSENQAVSGKNKKEDVKTAADGGANGPKPGKVRLEDYLVKDGRTNTSRIAKKGEKDAKRAELEYEVLAEKDDYKLVQVYLKTGRHHQIRVQMAHAGLPLYGDQKYNEKWQEYLVQEDTEKNAGRNESMNAGRNESMNAGRNESMNEDRNESMSAGRNGKMRTGQLALCAVSFSFRHPATGKQMKFEVKPENEVFGEF